MYSAVGAIDIVIPERGDYSLTGSSSYGDLRTDMPFNVKNKTIEGQLGEGEYRIKIEGNSDLTVQRNAEVPGLENNSTESQDTNENGEKRRIQVRMPTRIQRMTPHRRVDNKLAIAVQ